MVATPSRWKATSKSHHMSTPKSGECWGQGSPETPLEMRKDKLQAPEIPLCRNEWTLAFQHCRSHGLPGHDQFLQIAGLVSGLG